MRRTGRPGPARFVVVSLGLGALLALAGCGGAPEKGTELEVYLPGQIGSNIVMLPAEKGNLPAANTPSGASAGARAELPAASAPERAAHLAGRKKQPTAPKLIGLRSDQVSSLLGQPTRLRREPPAQVWQYAGGDCVLYVFLYRPQNDAHRSRVRYIESRDPTTAAREPTPNCINQVIRHRGGGNVS